MSSHKTAHDPHSPLPHHCWVCGKHVEPLTIPLGDRNMTLPQFVCESKECNDRENAWHAEQALSKSISHAKTALPPVIADTDPAKLPSDKARKIAMWKPQGKSSLFICGPSRTGKSRVMGMIAARLAAKKNTKPMWADTWVLEEAVNGKPAAFKELASQQILCLDDLGKERMTERMASGVFKLLDYRCANGLMTLISSNWTPSALAERFNDTTIADAVKGRIVEFYDRVLLDAKEGGDAK